MNSFFSAAFVAATLTLGSVSGFAQGTLSLTAKTGGQTDNLNITENAFGGIDGTFNSDAVSGSFSPSLDVMDIGSSSSNLTLTTPEDGVIQYNGTLGARTAQVKVTSISGGDILFFDGHITDGVNFKEVTGKAEVKGSSKSLKLYWDKYRLVIQSTSTPGACSGTLISANVTVTTFTCATTGIATGSTFDAFFRNPHHIVMWLMQLYVK